MTGSERTTAVIEGPALSAGASGWVEHWARFAAPAREAVARAAGITAGALVLDVGCGSGEFCELAAARGARVSGIDVAEGLVEIARRRLPEADLRVGPIERLPWRNESFDLVTGFNAFQFAADFVAALAEAARVTWRGGRVAIRNWGRIEDREVHAIFAPLREVEPRPPQDTSPYDRPRSASRGCSRISRGEWGSPPSARTRSRCRTSFPTARRSSARCSISRQFSASARTLPSGGFERRLRRMPSRSGDPMAPTGSRTGSGI